MTIERLISELQALINKEPNKGKENIYFGDKQQSVDYITIGSHGNNKIT